jgi:hypothetical protein
MKLDQLTDAELAAGSDDDRQWFKDHPQRNYRLRAPTAAERLGEDAAVLVCQKRPGVRMRTSITLAAPLAMYNCADDAWLANAWKQLTEIDPQIGQLSKALDGGEAA